MQFIEREAFPIRHVAAVHLTQIVYEEKTKIRIPYWESAQHTSVSPPSNVHFIRPEPLGTCRIAQFRCDSGSVLE